ncbi:MAG: hypothetical protein Rhirs2KO_21730 [Rhizobiaceae bacterium]
MLPSAQAIVVFATLKAMFHQRFVDLAPPTSGQIRAWNAGRFVDRKLVRTVECVVRAAQGGALSAVGGQAGLKHRVDRLAQMKSAGPWAQRYRQANGDKHATQGDTTDELTL